MPRFLAGTLPPPRDHLTLVPESGHNGSFIEWRDGFEFSLSAPILQISISDLLNEAIIGPAARSVQTMGSVRPFQLRLVEAGFTSVPHAAQLQRQPAP
jgi:hypothetical protein